MGGGGKFRQTSPPPSILGGHDYKTAGLKGTMYVNYIITSRSLKKVFLSVKTQITEKRCTCKKNGARPQLQKESFYF